MIGDVVNVNLVEDIVLLGVYAFVSLPMRLLACLPYREITIFALWYLIVGDHDLRKDLVPSYVRLLRDNEAEVRIAAAGKATKFSQILSPELSLQHILPSVKVNTSSFTC